jgi:hypothetical protein
MAILKDGVNGGFTGKVGSVIGYQLNGKWVIKGLPKLSKKNKKGTDKQNKCRSKFTTIQTFLSYVLDFIRVGFNLEAKAKGMSAHNFAKSYNMLHAFNGNGEIDYSRIKLAQGKLLGPADAAVQVHQNGLLFCWDQQISAGYERRSDQVMLLAFHAEGGFAYRRLSGNRRSAGQELLEIPRERISMGYHTWMAFIADDRQSISDSIYLGKVER